MNCDALIYFPSQCAIISIFSFYIALLDNAKMGSGFDGAKSPYKNQEQRDAAWRILRTHSTDALALDNHWARELVKILTNGKMTVEYHVFQVSTLGVS